jgi:hypothetical protein
MVSSLNKKDKIREISSCRSYREWKFKEEMAGTDSGVGMDQQEPNSVVDDEQRFNQ